MSKSNEHKISFSLANLENFNRLRNKVYIVQLLLCARKRQEEEDFPVKNCGKLLKNRSSTLPHKNWD